PYGLPIRTVIFLQFDKASIARGTHNCGCASDIEDWLRVASIATLP
ncbi:hypothetical protein HDG41_008138, partial [Paraburkholderia sp. JPY162]|nr:hypothetical protein [Paraburkholderia youngii]